MVGLAAWHTTKAFLGIAGDTDRQLLLQPRRLRVQTEATCRPLWMLSSPALTPGTP